MEKTYDPNSIEQHWYQTWENKGYFEPRGDGQPYCIMLPPPNVTGSLHMGHGFCFTVMDILIRYHRMQGENVLWQPGTDHAGIATQMVVERRLLQENKSRHDLGREKFIEKIWQWKKESGGTISQQLRRLGTSLNWKSECFTMDESLSHAVHTVFIKLHEEGLIYRGTRLVNWDPKLLTAISDLEVVSSEEEAKLYHIRYPLVESNDHIIVATTRPETLLGDVAVAVNPDDERYQKLIGKQLKLPLTDRTIPIIADDYVDKEFGSGCVKITPAHDFNDYAVGQRHKLIPINIFTPDAHINKNAPMAYQGLERFAAREKILKDLEAENLLEKIDKHIAKIPRGDRSGVVVEPYLTEQWFLNMKPLAEPAIKAVEDGEIKFVPENWSKTYFQWLNNIEDWCISRQLWWGHRIPAWYDKNKNVYVGEDEQDVRKRYKLADSVTLEQDHDVLDTWFSSALWPFSTLGWPEKTAEFNTFYPTSVLVTGFDIIFFWVARMIMMGLKFTGKVPFKEVLITGLIRDSDGQKMSKSKGNVIDPLDLIDGISIDALIAKRTQGLMQPAMAQKIEKTTRQHFPEGIAAYGTDALRFTFCALATQGREIRFDINRLEGYRNFCNKLWNAARYVLMNIAANPLPPLRGEVGRGGNLSLPDKWILSELENTISAAHEYLKSYRLDLFATTLYEFTWNQFCDWYLELTKPILYSDEDNSGTRYTLIYVLETLLRLMHPIMPFITEEIWQRVAPLIGKNSATLMLQSYPKKVELDYHDESVRHMNTIKNIIIGIRSIRSEMNISPSKPLPVSIRNWETSDKEFLNQQQSLMKALARLESITWLEENQTYPESATALAGKLEILIPLAGLIDKKEESARLNKEIAKLQKDAERAESKLQNPNFADKAPAEVVAKERDKLTELKTALSKLEKQLERINSL